MIIKPRRHYVLVKVSYDSPGERTTKGGIVIPITINEALATTHQLGEVASTGPGYRRDDGTYTPLDISIGDTVLFPKHAGNKIKENDEDFVLLEEHQILATY